jgi:putative nucleotidyltransferase with HDIG domain
VSKISAVILAAGQSSRMVRFKPLLPLGGQTVIQRTISLFKIAGVEDVRVVVGHRADELRPMIEKAGALSLFNADFDKAMFSSVLVGIKSFERDIEAFFILPADVPLVRPATLRAMIDGYRQVKDRVIHPCFKGERGHPPLIPSSVAQRVLEWKGRGGLKAALSQIEVQELEVEVADRHILFDLDTPDDYDEALTRWRHYHIPALDECEAILTRILGVEDNLILHSRAVSELTTLLARRLDQAGLPIDANLAARAALLHDLAKGHSRHDEEGGRLLRQMGFSLAAEIVESHIDIDLEARKGIGEAELVYLADKLILGNRLVSLEKRFEAGLKRFGRDPEIGPVIEQRLNNARTIKRLVERTIGRTVENLMENEAAEFDALVMDAHG